MKFICEIFSWTIVIFRDEFNESSSTMINYSDATVITPNHLLIMRSKTLSATTHATIPYLWRLFCN